MSIFFSQDSWLGINFEDLEVDLDKNSVAGKDFYSAFYQEMEKRFDSYQDFPENWLNSKRKSSQQMLALINNPVRVLSFGCGVGYFESELHKSIGPGLKITDFSPIALRFNPDLKNAFVSMDDLGQMAYSHIILNQVSYAVSDSDLLKLLEDLSNHLLPNGILLVSYSPPAKSMITESMRRNCKLIFDSFINVLRYRSMEKSNVKQLRQGWGWHRTQREMSQIIARSRRLRFRHHKFRDESIVEIFRVDC